MNEPPGIVSSNFWAGLADGTADACSTGCGVAPCALASLLLANFASLLDSRLHRRQVAFVRTGGGLFRRVFWNEWCCHVFHLPQLGSQPAPQLTQPSLLQ